MRPRPRRSVRREGRRSSRPRSRQPEKQPEQQPAAEQQPEPAPIENLGRETDPAVHAGVCEAQGWRPGRMVTEDEYQAAVTAWLEMRIDGQAT